MRENRPSGLMRGGKLAAHTVNFLPTLLFGHALLAETPFRVERGVCGWRARPAPRPLTPPPCETEFRSTAHDETEFRHEEGGGVTVGGR